jgi:Xaa-Pro aminopeptidase
MVLVDAGCEFFGYCSDITRTWPISGKFNDDRHKSLYEMMLEVQTELIKETGPGVTLDQLFRIMSTHLVKGLENLGIIKTGLANTNSASSDVALRFCPHHVGHHLGMDVHDVPTVERNEPLQPGMVITIEPGVYIRNVASQRDLLTKVGKEFIGIGIRIEDDVLVTTDGQSVLSASCPKSIEDIERWGVVAST